MALYDITQVMSVYFDRHLIFPLLEFLEQQQVLLCSLEHKHLTYRKHDTMVSTVALTTINTTIDDGRSIRWRRP